MKNMGNNTNKTENKKGAIAKFKKYLSDNALFFAAAFSTMNGSCGTLWERGILK